MTSGSHHSSLNLSALRARLYQWLLTNKVAALPADLQQVTTPVVILPRYSYRELHKDYPIEQQRELKKVLAVEYESTPFIRHVFAEPAHGKTPVSSYLPDQSVITALPHNAVLLPETYLLGLALLPGQAAEVQIAGRAPFFIANILGQISSLQRSALCADIAAFLLYVGLPDDAEVLHIEAEQYSRLLQKGFHCLQVTDFFNFWQSGLKQTAAFNWRPPALAAAVTVASYAALSSAWLMYQVSASQAQAESLGAELNEVLAIQQDINRMAAVSSQLQQSFQANASSAQLWSVVLDMQANGDSLQAVSMKGAKLELRGTSDKATDTLQRLVASPLLSNAQFNSPVTKQRKQEAFAIAAQVKLEAADAAK
ncbi:PilN domain-containing protein [Rheinheimera texasensis]|uniref:PilN domain-containing protein n=1 Tax=Rheinheimera texasensis TaxID=306205 RepID=UPI0004E18F58|nr:PilN domain-containing protein [Rheinheimera texasensis]